MTVQIDPAVDRALKDKHRSMWALGDYPTVAAQIIPELGAALVQAADVRPGQRVLDVAAGSSLFVQGKGVLRVQQRAALGRRQLRPGARRKCSVRRGDGAVHVGFAGDQRVHDPQLGLMPQQGRDQVSGRVLAENEFAVTMSQGPAFSPPLKLVGFHA